MISVENLRFRYPKQNKYVLEEISFSQRKGEILGFLGPSGAGKSTLQKILIGILKQYIGSVKIQNIEMKQQVPAYNNTIGVAFEFPNFYQKFSGLENLVFFSKLYTGPMRDPVELLQKVNLERDADTLFSRYSKGMKMRLNFCRALMNSPQLLFLDEPTSGLDPVNAQLMKKLIQEEQQKGTTIVITTHDMHIAEQLCDRVAFIVDGRVSVIDTPLHLKLMYGDKKVTVRYEGNDCIQQQSFHLQTLKADSSFMDILTNKTILTMHTKEASLEEVFIHLTGKSLL
ncbi:ABC transporter ATP-binding protein [Bacillus sp. 2205SS5-2]|uniref:ABC transporter ATP-binding protein n=1 Tax=Bacillus sp. 2205SS5-2 TaxID=3109031 RepID=UPI0030079539